MSLKIKNLDIYINLIKKYKLVPQNTYIVIYSVSVAECKSQYCILAKYSVLTHSSSLPARCSALFLFRDLTGSENLT